MTGSRRMSVNDDPPPLLVGGFPPPPMKLLTAALRLYSSSTSRLCRFLMKRKMPPPIAAMATIPTTAPAAMLALLGELDDADLVVGDAVAALSAVAVTVCPPRVTTDGFAVLVLEAVGPAVAEELLSSKLDTLFETPVRYKL
jgi:hypothetical protein